jgi:uncharacterized membrane protein
VDFRDYRVLYIFVIGALALFVASPALQRLLVYPRTEFLSEMWLLDSEHTDENYPYAIVRGEKHNVFLGVSNRLGHSAYYIIEVKFRNQTQPAADSLTRTASSLSSLCSIRTFVGDKESCEIPISFSFNYVQENYNSTTQQVRFLEMMLNENVVDLEEYTALWDADENGFLTNLFFELWIYNDIVGDFQYHERFTGLWLNIVS